MLGGTKLPHWPWTVMLPTRRTDRTAKIATVRRHVSTDKLKTDIRAPQSIFPWILHRPGKTPRLRPTLPQYTNTAVPRTLAGFATIMHHFQCAANHLYNLPIDLRPRQVKRPTSLVTYPAPHPAAA